VTPPAAPITAAPAVQQQPASSFIERFRRILLRLMWLSSLAALGAALVVLLGNNVANARYHAIVNEGATSADAAQDARAAVLDSTAANADLLAQSDPAVRQHDRELASQRWEDFTNALRISWRNRSDVAQGEYAVFQTADRAAADYAGWIGAMNAAVDANRPDEARTAFLSAYSVLQTRLLPPLVGVQSVKVEFMKSRYASTSSAIRAWLVALVAVSAIVALLTLLGYALTRRMHYRLTPELLLTLVLAVGIAAWVGMQLRRADTQVQVMVRDAYDTVAGVRDEAALVDQQNALQSVAIFDPGAAAGHFTDIDEYSTLFELGLCGQPGCSSTSFLSSGAGDTIDPSVAAAALQKQEELSLPRIPLVANVRFAGEAAALEQARVAYQSFLAAGMTTRAAVQSGNTAAALAANTGPGAQAFAQTRDQLDRAREAARRVYDRIWRSVEDATTIGRWLAAGDVLAAALLLRGLWRRRRELFAVR